MISGARSSSFPPQLLKASRATMKMVLVSPTPIFLDVIFVVVVLVDAAHVVAITSTPGPIYGRQLRLKNKCTA